MSETNVHRPTPATASGTARVVRSGPADRARGLLRADAAVCAATGVVTLAAAGPLAGALAEDRVGLLRIAGAVLVVAAVDLVLLSRSQPDRLVTAVAVAAAVNLAWVAATAAVVATGLLSAAGIVVAELGAVVAAAFAWREVSAARAIRRNHQHMAEVRAS